MTRFAITFKDASWLRVLCVVLFAWQPITFAQSASQALGALPVRGYPVALVLVARLLATALGVAAGIGIVNRRAAAVPMTVLALAASAALDVFVSTTSYFPSNRMPGDEPLYAAGSVIFYGAWIAYMLRSTRVKRTLTS